MRSSDTMFVRFMIPAAALLVAACAPATPPLATSAQPVANPCASSGTGMTSPATAETLAAMAAHTAATKLSIEELQQGVARGDSAAQIELGLRYANGKDVPVDSDRALKLFEIAARDGNPLGFYFIGIAFSNGAGVPQDDSRAVFYWEQAARQGYANAQYWLGMYIGNGRGGVTPNWCAGAALLEAASQTHSEAAFMLGLLHQQGAVFGETLDRVDWQRVAQWYRKANALEFNQKAQYNLRALIDNYVIEWKPGDPGKPPPPKPADWGKRQEMQLKMPDNARDSTG